MASSGTKNGSVYFRCYLSSFVRKPIVCIALEVKSQKSKVIAICGFKDHAEKNHMQHYQYFLNQYIFIKTRMQNIIKD